VSFSERQLRLGQAGILLGPDGGRLAQAGAGLLKAKTRGARQAFPTLRLSTSGLGCLTTFKMEQTSDDQ